MNRDPAKQAAVVVACNEVAIGSYPRTDERRAWVGIVQRS